MQLSITERQFDGVFVTKGDFNQSEAVPSGFPLQFSQPASLVGQSAPFYRSLDGFPYKASCSLTASVSLAPEHRPALRSCLVYGVEQGYIQESDLSVLFNDKGEPNDGAALELASKVMAGISGQLNDYRKKIIDDVLFTGSLGGGADVEDMKGLIGWWECHWLPKLSLSYVDEDFGDYGEHASTMALRMVRDHYVAYMSFDVWDLPKSLQSLLILAIQAFSVMASKPVSLIDLEDMVFFEWREECDHLYELVVEEIPYWLESDGVDVGKEYLLVMAQEQCREFLNELEEMVGEDYSDVLWCEVISRYRRSVWDAALVSGGALDGGCSESGYLKTIQSTLHDWDRLQNPMLGHPMAVRLRVLCELYLQQPFSGQSVCLPVDSNYCGEVSFNEAAIISTGDEREDEWITSSSEGVASGEYSYEVLGLHFNDDLELSIKNMLFGDLALICLQGGV